MGNGRKFRRTKNKINGPTLFQESALKKVTIPTDEKVVMKEVPCKAGDEVIGRTLVYDDGTFDLIIYEGISDKARRDLADFKSVMLDRFGHYSIREEEDGSPEQVAIDADATDSSTDV